MYSQRPSWLEVCCSDSRPTPTLFAWNVSNLASYDGSDLSTSTASGDSDKRIYILGIGNLGRLFASSLAQAPNKPPITLVVHRKELLEQWAEGQGIEILRNGKLEKNKDFDIEWWTEAEPDIGPIREVAEGDKLKNLIITTKASASLPQVDRVRGYLDRNSTVLFVQNGMSKLWPPYGSFSSKFLVRRQNGLFGKAIAGGAALRGQIGAPRRVMDTAVGEIGGQCDNKSPHGHSRVQEWRSV
ncbi:hypothetical protein FPSE5266_08659 [Fusarium pseudograminearum]|nr:hypothetical protein FPSE5266_08659 [Fusarium pseudograminearum]